MTLNRCVLLIVLTFSTACSQTTPASSDENGKTPAIEKEYFKYRVCSASTTGELFRFNLDRACPSTEDKVHREGILLVYKKNIVPHIFKVRRYKKIATSVRIFNGWSREGVAITNKWELSRAVPKYEINLMDKNYQCHNCMQIEVNGLLNSYCDRDGNNKTVDLKPVDGLTGAITRYVSQPKIFADAGWLWGTYKTRTTVNCEIVEMFARSADPYTYFVTALGDTVEVSPFCDAENSCPNASDVLSSQVDFNHTVVDYGNRATSQQHGKRIFAHTLDYSVSWEAINKTTSVCSMVFWKGFQRAIQTEHDSTYHFIANEITAGFSTSKETLASFSSEYSCLMSDINSTLTDKIGRVNNTHVPNGTAQYFKTEGGMILVWQPLTAIELEEAMIEATTVSPTPLSTAHLTSRRTGRRKRDVSAGSENSVLLAQIQYAYDKLRQSINNVLEELAITWCREQVRQTMIWYEIAKINPTSVMTAIYGKPVSAKALGDVISVTECINVDQTSVSIHKSLKTTNNDVCYSRPPVTFKFVNSSQLFKGQLGARNEILLSESLVENCHQNAEHFFTAKNETYHFKNYLHVETLPLTNISTLDTFLALNLTFIENIDFKAVELYSSGERKLANVFDLETMFREYNYYAQSISGLRKDFDNSQRNNRDRIIQDFSEILADLGSIGKVIVNIASSAFSLFGGIVTGILNFIKNPLGGMLTFLLVGAIIILVILLVRRTNNMSQAPIRMIYPDIEKSRSSVTPTEPEVIKQILLGMHNMQQEEYKKREEHKASQPSFLKRATDAFLRKRAGYKQISTEDKMI
ncbi:glycoprotein B [Ateline gammaherpesvirus 3]|uniref:Glycoprotein B n=1 Tax=Ateline herpesvirus 3 TaxID=85618 RepID=Q9YTQ5_ATHV3|nr:glycoprotein B [Ateline gammaherpesvirus 3]AAC95532.1 glycoprotein B [Ateline gammaherpesvirus 3]